MMESRFLFIIDNIQNLSNNEPIIIAFSGGIDSVCLLELFKKTSKRLIIAHLNHGIREKADQDEEFSRKVAKRGNCEFISEKADVTTFAKLNHLSIEEAARKKRYEFLFKIAREKGAKLIAVGHHADDQVETVMMHFLRGSGLSGLGGMREKSIIPEFDPNIMIIRPLLTFWRSEIENYCKINKLNYVVDETNFSEIYERNRIRNKILPYLNNLYPGLNNRIHKMANIIQNEDEFIKDQLQNSWNKCCLQVDDRFIQLDKFVFLELPLALKRRIIRKAVFTIKPDVRDLSFHNIDGLIHYLLKNKPGEIDLQENLIAVVGSKEIIIGSKSKGWIDILYPQLNETVEFNINEKKTINISNNWIFEFKNCSNEEMITNKKEDEFIVFLDADSIGNENIFLRYRIAGDRFQPLGMEKGSIKISDFFINKKLEKAARDRWPLVVNSYGEIIWLPGLRPGNKFRMKESTTRIIQFSINKHYSKEY